MSNRAVRSASISASAEVSSACSLAMLFMVFSLQVRAEVEAARLSVDGVRCVFAERLVAVQATGAIGGGVIANHVATGAAWVLWLGLSRAVVPAHFAVD